MAEVPLERLEKVSPEQLASLATGVHGARACWDHVAQAEGEWQPQKALWLNTSATSLSE